MIDKEIFAQRMGLLGGRIKSELEPAVQAEYYRQLSPLLTTEQFVAATGLAFATWSATYRNWPSPKELVELITPIAAPTLTASEAFEEVLDLTNQPNATMGESLVRIQTLGAATLRAYRAAGGWRDFRNVLEPDVTWVRRRFVEAYESATENADAERAATLALAAAEDAVKSLVNVTAHKLSADEQSRRRRLGAGEPTEKAS